MSALLRDRSVGSIGKIIFALRKAQKLSRTCLAQRARISQEHLWAVETGQYAPSLRTIEKLAVGLNIGINQLFDQPAVLLHDPLIRAAAPLVRNLNQRQRSQVLSVMRRIGGPSWARNGW